MRNSLNIKVAAVSAVSAVTLGLLVGAISSVYARNGERQSVMNRQDIRNLPRPLRERLGELAARPSTYPPAKAFSEADDPSALVQYFLIDTTDFQPNVFTTTIPEINGGTRPTATGPNGDLPTIGAIRAVLEPKPGLPTDPNDPGAFIDMFTDVSGLFVINNESGWYEGWIIRDIKVPPISDETRPDGRALYGTMTREDAEANAARGDGNNAVVGNFVTTDGNEMRPISPSDRFPDIQSNVVPIPVSLGTFNATQQSDIHSYWEFNPETNWIFPHYELPFTGGIPGTFESGNASAGALTLLLANPSTIPGPGPAGAQNDPILYGDDPNNPRDPDRAALNSLDDPDRPQSPNPENLETRLRFIPSRLTEEILFDVMVRIASFEPEVTDVAQRFFDAYAYEVSLVDQNGDGVISFVEADIDGTSDGQPNSRLFLPITAFNRYAMTREINDGLLAPRFAPGQRGYVMDGDSVNVEVDPDNLSQEPPASVPRDADDR